METEGRKSFCPGNPRYNCTPSFNGGIDTIFGIQNHLFALAEEQEQDAYSPDLHRSSVAAALDYRDALLELAVDLDEITRLLKFSTRSTRK